MHVKVVKKIENWFIFAKVVIFHQQ